MKFNKIYFIFLLVLSVAIYLNSLFGEFLLDDDGLIQNNPTIQSFQNIEWSTYRVVRTISYAIDYKFWEQEPFGYHLSNLFYNTLTVAVVFFLTFRLAGNLFVAFLTTLLFAIHPIHTEAVSYLSGRRDILSSLFYLLGFFLYIVGKQEKRRGYYVLCLISFVLGVLSKEMAITLPLMIFAYEIIAWIERNKKEEYSRFSQLANAFMATVKSFKWVLLSFLIFVFSYLYMVVFLQDASGMVRSDRFLWWGGSPIANFTTACRVVAAYIQKLFFPIVLHPDYHQFEFTRTFMEAKFLMAFLLMIIVIGLSFRMLKHDGLLTFSIWWFFITLLPVIHIIPHHMLMAEHYLYLPSYGFCLGVSLVLFRIFQQEKFKVIVVGLSAIIAILFSIRTVDRNQDWQNISFLMKEGIWHTPENPLYHFFLGRDYSMNKLLTSAQKELSKAIGPRHDLPNVHAEKAHVAFQLGDYELGIMETEETLKGNPNHQTAIYQMGYYAAKMGDHQKALEHYLMVDPSVGSGNAMLNAAQLYIESGDLEKAEEMLLKLKAFHPANYAALFTLAEVYAKMFRFDESMEQYHYLLSKSDEITYQDSGTGDIINMKRVEASLNGVNQLKEKYELAMNVLKKGNLSAGHYLLGEVYVEIGNYESAEKELTKAIKELDQAESIGLLLAEIYMESGRFQEAENVYKSLLASGSEESKDILIAAGRLFAKSLRFKKSNELFSSALEKDPEDERIREYLKWSVQLLKLHEESERHQQSGRPIQSALYKSDAYKLVGREQDALDVLENVIQADPDHLQLLMRLATFYEEMGYPYRKKTIMTYKHLLSLDPGNAEAHRKLGEYYYRVIEDYESALNYLRRSLEISPKHEDSQSIQAACDRLQEYVSIYHGE